MSQSARADEQFKDAQTWTIVDLSLYTPVLAGLLIVSIASLFLIHRRRDHARTGFLWYKIAIPLLALGFILMLVGDAIAIVIYGWYFSDRETIESRVDSIINLERVSSMISYPGTMFISFGGALLLVALAEVASGFLFVQAAQRRTAMQRGMRGGIIGLAGAIIGLSIAAMALGEAAQTQLNKFRQDPAWEPFEKAQRLSRKGQLLGGARDVLMWIGAAAVLAYAVFVVRKVKVVHHLRSSGRLFLIATILFFISVTWDFIYACIWRFPADPITFSNSISAVNAILDYWLKFAAVVFLFLLGKRKGNGLWSSEQAVTKDQEE